MLAFLPWLALAVAQVLDAWFLCDDAFICFRCARNLIEGHGLVFNRGERVEGYTQLACAAGAGLDYRVASSFGRVRATCSAARSR